MWAVGGGNLGTAVFAGADRELVEVFEPRETIQMLIARIMVVALSKVSICVNLEIEQADAH